jgi:hypothetical protein
MVERIDLDPGQLGSSVTATATKRRFATTMTLIWFRKASIYHIKDVG